jgi:hypothetical protein
MLRPAPSRKQTSNANAMHLSPHPKPGISVEEWESKAPLGEIELRSIAAVKAAGEHLPLPLKVRTSTLCYCCMLHAACGVAAAIRVRDELTPTRKVQRSR